MNSKNQQAKYGLDEITKWSEVLLRRFTIDRAYKAYAYARLIYRSHKVCAKFESTH